MKKKTILIIFVIFIGIISVGAISFMATLNNNITTYHDFNYDKLNLSSVKDGTYTGSEDGNIVKATVAVTVKNHKITDVKIISHENGKGKPAESIVNDIVRKNSLDVDTVSGATYSSYVLKKATYNALTK